MSATPRKRAAAGLTAGDEFTYSRTFIRRDTEAFGDLTLDYNPVHYDERFSAAKGFSGLVCHGLLVGSLLCTMGGQVAWLATSMSFRFRKPVYFGDTITCTVTISEIDETGRAAADAVCVNQHGVEVVTAHMTGRVPAAPAEREALEKMMAEGDPTNELRDWTDDPARPLRLPRDESA